MTQSTHHPSYLELDRHSLGVGTEETARHAAQCEQCAAQLALLQRPVATPEWIHAIKGGKPGSRPWFLRGWAAAMAGGLACALLVGVAVNGLRLENRSEEGGIRSLASLQVTRAKGGASAAVYVLRRGAVTLWDGDSPLEPGDRIQLEIRPEKYRHVTVLSGAGPDSGVLYHMPLSPTPGGLLLPLSWEVDDRGRSESLTVVLSMDPLPEEKALSLTGASVHQEGLWTTHIVLPKRGHR